MRKKQKVTIADIARELNVSPSTVSTALTGRRNGVFVSEDTRNRVVDTAERMGYSLGNLRARKPKLNRVALLHKAHISKVRAGRDPLFAAMVLHLCDLLNRQGCRVSVRVGHEQHEEDEIIRDLHRRYEIDAAVFIGSRDWPELPEMQGIPVVVIGEVPEGMPVCRVSVDNYSASRTVAEHLWSLGHRRVGVVLPEALIAVSVTSQDRMNGLRSVWKERTGGFPDEWILPITYFGGDDEYVTQLTTLLEQAAQKDGPLSALFCFNDWVAGRIMKALKRIGMRVPEDMSVVGFDDSPYSQLLDPPLTTVHQPLEELSALAAQLLLETACQSDGTTRSYTVAANLVIRQSTAPPS